MTRLETLEPAIDPNNRIAFLLDWELTLKCNLDCSYCTTGLYGGHDNSTQHPALDQCLSTIDFMFEYVDLYMKHKPKGLRHVILNVYGGESLHHPDIVEILQQVKQKYQIYQERWHLTVTTTTNAIISKRRLESILPLIDEFTVSYHSENSEKNKKTFRDNCLSIQKNGNRLKTVVLMHTDKELFDDCQNMITWLESQNIKYLARQLDDATRRTHDYSHKQITWFDSYYQRKSFGATTSIEIDSGNLSNHGRACCGGRQMCQNQEYRSRSFYIINNEFPDWHCSVNWFFLFVKQVTGEIFTNKDCKMNFQGSVGPIGSLSDSKKLLIELEQHLANKSLPVIQCKKQNCFCGLCAPKAKTLEDYQTIIKKYIKDYEL